MNVQRSARRRTSGRGAHGRTHVGAEREAEELRHPPRLATGQGWREDKAGPSARDVHPFGSQDGAEGHVKRPPQASPFDYLFASDVSGEPSRQPEASPLLPPDLLRAAEAVLKIPIPGLRVRRDAGLEAQGLSAVARDPDIYLSPRAPQADSRAGRRLLGHELTHIAQQRRGKVPTGRALHEDPPLEAEADRVGAAIASRGARPASPSAPGGPSSRPGQRGSSSDPFTEALRPRAGAAPQPQRASEGERATERGQGEFDRRTPPPTQSSSDGSGVWASEAATLTDHANRAFWGGVASAAEAMGLTHAARHMRHYLGNTGAPLRADGDLMLRDSPSLARGFEQEVARAQADAEARLRGLSTTEAQGFSFQGPRRGHYFRRGETADWFFAVGGCTYWITADVIYLPPTGAGGRGMAELDAVLHVFDRYNWDQGKSISLAGLTVKDEQLGRLHRVGLAQEYAISARSSTKRVRWAVGDAPQSTEILQEPEAREPEGGRADPGRDDD